MSGAGRNTHGQLGQAHATRRWPSVIPSGGRGSPWRNQNTTAISAGYGHSLFLKAAGTVFAAGLNANSQLGDAVRFRYLPVQVTGAGSDNVAVAAGGYHSLVAKLNSGLVYAFGRNDRGQLGLGPSNQTDQRLPSLMPIADIPAVTTSA